MLQTTVYTTFLLIYDHVTLSELSLPIVSAVIFHFWQWQTVRTLKGGCCLIYFFFLFPGAPTPVFGIK